MSKKQSIAIFTKTNWSEPPRIRHQLTRLLCSYGHEITFFEKSNIRHISTSKYKHEGINFVKHFELIPQKLRIFNFLVKLNQALAKYLIKQSISRVDIDLIINFNYDYSFLKEIFHQKKIITIINDDFVAQHKYWIANSIFKQLKSTCENSDLVFAVSYPLCEQLNQFNGNTNILLPWAESHYMYPNMSSKRDVVLYWGFIDHRIDWSIIEYLLSNNIKLRFVGFINQEINDQIKKYTVYDNFELISPTPINNLYMGDICCSILPYCTKSDAIRVVTVNNRVFQLLARGIPLVYSDLPNLIKSPNTVITKCRSNEAYMNAIEFFSSNFASCQTDIEVFLEEHYSDARYNYLFDKINKIKHND